MRSRLSVVTLVLAACLGLLEVTVTAQPPARWTCDVDLHQGDVGTLQLNVTGSALDGSLTVRRGGAAPPVTTAVRGSWNGDVVRFTRTLSATSEQPFLGIAAREGDRPVKMAGRFAAGFEGLWSATCSRTGAGGDKPPEPPVPPKGPVGPPDRSGSCSISGAATGPRAGIAKVYALVLYGPDDARRPRARHPFSGGAYSFRNLPDGEYVIVPDTKADVAVSVNPRRQVVHCRGGAVTGANFDFR